MFVKKITAVGKSFLLLSSLTLAACSSNPPANTSLSTVSSVNTDYAPSTSSLNIVANFARWNHYKMSREDRQRQERAVFFALEQLPINEYTYWRNEHTGAAGSVIVHMAYPQGSGYCKVLSNEVIYKGKSRYFQETACKNAVEQGWTFVRR